MEYKPQGSIHIFTDSQQIVDTMMILSFEGWKEHRGKKRNKDNTMQRTLWKKIYKKTKKLKVEFHWVKGHAGNPRNEKCDRLAKLEAQLQYENNNMQERYA